MRMLGRLAAAFVAALAWSAVAVMLVDWSGLAARRSAVLAAVPVDDDPCALRAGLAVGNDARCGFPVEQVGGPPLSVELDQSWAMARLGR